MIKIRSYVEVKAKEIQKPPSKKFEFDIIDFAGGKLNPSDAFYYQGLRLKFNNYGYNDVMSATKNKSKICLQAKFFKDGEFFVGRLVDYPEIFSDDYTLEGLINRLKESFSLYFNIKTDHIDYVVEIHEDPKLIETYN